MIKVENITPSVYSVQSRDFQYIGRLYDIVLNSIKTNADLVYAIPNGINSDEKLLNLLAYTLGFKARRHYNSTQLLAICNALPTILRFKGSLMAVFLAVNTLIKSEELIDTLDYGNHNGHITLFVPKDLSDLNLLIDLLDYLMPAGMSYDLVREVKETVNVNTQVEFSDKVTISKEDVVPLSGIWNGTDVIETQTATNPYLLQNTAIGYYDKSSSHNNTGGNNNG